MDDLAVFKAVVRETRGVTSAPGSATKALGRIRAILGVTPPAPSVADEESVRTRKERRSHDRLERTGEDRSGE